MNAAQFKAFDTFRKELRAYCTDFNNRFGAELAPLQQAAANAKKTPAYPIETPVVYNTALDELTQDSLITKIVIGDNPGKNEQLKANQKYLIGLAGTIAANFFKNHPEFNTDFRKNVIILNKTPVHSAKTNQLKDIVKDASPELKKAINDSAVWMAQKTAALHQKLCAAAEDKASIPELWLVGYAELKGRGLFLNYRDELKKAYENSPEAWKKVLVFQHFSMSRFTIDLSDYMETNGLSDLKASVEALGEIHRKEIFA